MRYVFDIIKGAISLLLGMGVTIKEFFKPVVTCQYPRETVNITPMFRGHTKLVADEENPDRTKCMACNICMRDCPSNAIKKIEGEKKEGEKRKRATEYVLDFTLCSQCGICVEVCPTKALAFSADYNLAGFKREDFHFDLIKEFKERERRE